MQLVGGGRVQLVGELAPTETLKETSSCARSTAALARRVGAAHGGGHVIARRCTTSWRMTEVTEGETRTAAGHLATIAIISR